MNGDFTKEDTHIANKYTKKCSISSATRVMQMKPCGKYNLFLTAFFLSDCLLSVTQSLVNLLIHELIHSFI